MGPTVTYFGTFQRTKTGELQQEKDGTDPEEDVAVSYSQIHYDVAVFVLVATCDVALEGW